MFAKKKKKKKKGLHGSVQMALVPNMDTVSNTFKPGTYYNHDTGQEDYVGGILYNCFCEPVCSDANADWDNTQLLWNDSGLDDSVLTLCVKVPSHHESKVFFFFLVVRNGNLVCFSANTHTHTHKKKKKILSIHNTEDGDLNNNPLYRVEFYGTAVPLPWFYVPTWYDPCYEVYCIDIDVRTPLPPRPPWFLRSWQL